MTNNPDSYRDEKFKIQTTRLVWGFEFGLLDIIWVLSFEIFICYQGVRRRNRTCHRSRQTSTKKPPDLSDGFVYFLFRYAACSSGCNSFCFPASYCFFNSIACFLFFEYLM